MNPIRFTRRPLAVAAMAATALLAACGGGSDDESLSAEIAQGYAADGATMSVAGASGVDAATETLEAALASNAVAAAPREQLLAANATPAATATASATCPNGGTVAWSVTGDAATLGNGQLDAGETYTVTYANCGTADGAGRLDGSASLAVTTRTSSSVVFTHQTTNLTHTTANGVFVHNGSATVNRSVATTGSGGREVTRRITSPGISLTSTIGARQASYNLRSLDWTVVRTYGAGGALTSRTHQGAVVIDASTPRRPNATLSVTTQGTLMFDGGNATAQGSFTIVTARDTIACSYGNGSATLTLDRGNDGTIDRTWTITFTTLQGEAG